MQKSSAVYYCGQVERNGSAFTVRGMTKDDESYGRDESNRHVGISRIGYGKQC